MQIANRIEDVEAERLKLELRLALLEGQEQHKILSLVSLGTCGLKR